MAPSAEERPSPPPGEGTRWRLALLLPVMAISGAAVVWTFLRVWEAQSRLAAAGAPRTWWLAVTFRESTAQAVLKSSLIGDEPAPILNYKQHNPDFPHQTTGDQFFDDDQFESFRALGAIAAHTAFREVSDTAWEPGRGEVWEGAWANPA
jgi:hypothetical protein